MGHINELYDFTTSAFIVNDGRVLLQHHKKIGMWLQPGGHIELDEDPLQALYREIEEESGLVKNNLTIISLSKGQRFSSSSTNAKVLPLPFDINVHNFDDTHKHIDLCYLMKSDTDKVILEKDKAFNIDWFTLDAISSLLEDHLLYPDTYELAKIALKHTALT